MIKYLIAMVLAAVIVWAALHSVRRARHGGGCCGEKETAEKRIAVRDKNKSNYPYFIEMKIGGMTCENCARRVENALNALDGVWVKVELSSHTAKVRLKEPPDKTKLAGAVVEAGYAVTGMNVKSQRN